MENSEGTKERSQSIKSIHRKVQILTSNEGLGVILRIGNGIDRHDGVFVDRVSLGSVIDEQNLLKAGDEILEINNINSAYFALSDVAALLLNSSETILETKCSLENVLSMSKEATGDHEDLADKSKGSSADVHDAPGQLTGYHPVKDSMEVSDIEIDSDSDIDDTIESSDRVQKRKEKSSIIPPLPDNIYKTCTSDKLDRVTSNESGISGVLSVKIIKLVPNLLAMASFTADTKMFCSIEIDDDAAVTSLKPIKGDAVLFEECYDFDVYHSNVIRFNIFHRYSRTKIDTMISEGCLYLERIFKFNSETKLRLQTSSNIDIFVEMEFNDIRRSMTRSFSREINLVHTLVMEKNSIPIIVRKCVEEIEKRGLDLKGIYRKPALASKMKELRSNFDRNGRKTDVSESAGIDCYVLAGVLKEYLRELPESLITENVFESICEIRASGEFNTPDSSLVSKLLRSLPRANVVPLKYIINHLLLVADHCDQNLMTRYNLSVPFGPTLIGSKVLLIDIEKPAQAVNFLLEIWPREETVVQL